MPSPTLPDVRPYLRHPNVTVRNTAFTVVGKLGEAGIGDRVSILRQGDAVLVP